MNLDSVVITGRNSRFAWVIRLEGNIVSFIFGASLYFPFIFKAFCNVTS